MKQFARYLLVLVYTVLVTLVYWYLYKKPLIGIDDANIYFQYIRNFAEGHGFVYNVGSERVEGFTSMLWVLLMTPLYFTGPWFELSVLAFNVLVVSFIFFIGIRFINRITGSPHFFSAPAYLFMLLLTLIPGYVDWAILTLMETSIWSLFLVSITIMLCRDPLDGFTTRAVGVGIGVLVFIRPESLLWGMGFTALIVALRFLDSRDIKKSLIAGIFPLIMFVLAVVVLAFFRIQYFGFPLPNTYYAKVSSDLIYNLTEGMKYLIFCTFQSPLMAPITLAVLFSWALLGMNIYRQIRTTGVVVLSSAERTQFVLVFVGLISIGIPIYVGGDHFKLLRFYQPFFPVYFFILFNLPFWRQVIRVDFGFKMTRVAGLALISLLIPFIYLITKTPLDTFRKKGSPIDWEFRLAELGRIEGKKMNELFAPVGELPTVGVSAAGGIAYGYKGFVYDLMGLNNVVMAHRDKVKVGMKNHAAFNKDVFFEQGPQIFHGYTKISFFTNTLQDSLIVENTADFTETHVFKLYKKIFSDERFLKQYSPVIIYREDKGLFLSTYCRNDYIPELEKAGIGVKRLSRGITYPHTTIVP